MGDRYVHYSMEEKVMIFLEWQKISSDWEEDPDWEGLSELLDGYRRPQNLEQKGSRIYKNEHIARINSEKYDHVPNLKEYLRQNIAPALIIPVLDRDDGPEELPPDKPDKDTDQVLPEPVGPSEDEWFFRPVFPSAGQGMTPGYAVGLLVFILILAGVIYAVL